MNIRDICAPDCIRLVGRKVPLKDILQLVREVLAMRGDGIRLYPAGSDAHLLHVAGHSALGSIVASLMKLRCDLRRTIDTIAAVIDGFDRILDCGLMKALFAGLAVQPAVIAASRNA